MSAHHADQLLHDGEPKSGAAVFSRYRSVRLREGVENLFLSMQRNANARIGYLNAHPSLIAVVRPHEDRHIPRLGEFEGIADQVGQNLTESVWIAVDHVPRFRRNGHAQRQSLFSSLFVIEPDSFSEHLTETEGDVFQDQAVGFDLGEIQNVIDDVQQAGSRVVHGVGVSALFVVQRGRQEEFGHAEDAVHGGSNFMTHVGQELRFGQAGSLGGFLRATEALFLLFSLGNVPHEDGELLRPADGETAHGDFHGETCSLAGVAQHFTTPVEDGSGD